MTLFSLLIHDITVAHILFGLKFSPEKFHSFLAQAAMRSENFEKNHFFAIQSGITVYILFHMENVIWNQI